MRKQDGNKKEKILNATIEFVVMYGIESLSMSKLAKEVGISQSTIYIYYKSKEELLQICYKTVKNKMGEYCRKDIRIDMTAKEIINQYMHNLYRFTKENLSYMLFLDISFLNISNAMEVIQKEIEPVFYVIDEKIEKGELQNYSSKMLLMYCYFPILQMAREYKVNPKLNLEKRLKVLKNLSWNAIKK